MEGGGISYFKERQTHLTLFRNGSTKDHFNLVIFYDNIHEHSKFSAKIDLT